MTDDEIVAFLDAPDPSAPWFRPMTLQDIGRRAVHDLLAGAESPAAFSLARAAARGDLVRRRERTGRKPDGLGSRLYMLEARLRVTGEANPARRIAEALQRKEREPKTERGVRQRIQRFLGA